MTALCVPSRLFLHSPYCHSSCPPCLALPFPLFLTSLLALSRLPLSPSCPLYFSSAVLSLLSFPPQFRLAPYSILSLFLVFLPLPLVSLLPFSLSFPPYLTFFLLHVLSFSISLSLSLFPPHFLPHHLFLFFSLLFSLLFESSHCLSLFLYSLFRFLLLPSFPLLFLLLSLLFLLSFLPSF